MMYSEQTMMMALIMLMVAYSCYGAASYLRKIMVVLGNVNQQGNISASFDDVIISLGLIAAGVFMQVVAAYGVAFVVMRIWGIVA